MSGAGVSSRGTTLFRPAAAEQWQLLLIYCWLLRSFFAR